MRWNSRLGSRWGRESQGNCEIKPMKFNFFITEENVGCWIFFWERGVATKFEVGFPKFCQSLRNFDQTFKNSGLKIFNSTKFGHIFEQKCDQLVSFLVWEKFKSCFSASTHMQPKQKHVVQMLAAKHQLAALQVFLTFSPNCDESLGDFMTSHKLEEKQKIKLILKILEDNFWSVSLPVPSNLQHSCVCDR